MSAGLVSTELNSCLFMCLHMCMGPTFMTSFNPLHSFRALPPNTATQGVRTSVYEFGVDTIRSITHELSDIYNNCLGVHLNVIVEQSELQKVN